MGAPPPTRMAPMDTCTDERRLMLMGTCGANSTVARLGRHSRRLLSYVRPNRSVRRESGASRNAEGANSARKRSGTGTADGGRCNLRGASGERWSRIASTHRRGAALTERLISQVTGQKGGRRLRRRCACRLFCLAESPLRRFQRTMRLQERFRGKDRKSTRLNSSHEWISYAVFCLKKKRKQNTKTQK